MIECNEKKKSFSKDANLGAKNFTKQLKIEKTKKEKDYLKKA